ncbi:C40 family peptidase [Actinoplanes sp. RD1]|uniref:C40 family peptidase n=1 Tax=Actinoplanes sp. RD1 TaxID=3064538 RepID=UPI002740C034|nr:NlpC/P60 family protein [Actinoplanes sp. RD1]
MPNSLLLRVAVLPVVTAALLPLPAAAHPAPRALEGPTAVAPATAAFSPAAAHPASLALAPSAHEHVAPLPALHRRKDRPTASELDKRITAAARRLEVVVEHYNNSRDDLRTTRSRIQQLNARLRPLTRELEQRQALMDALLARTYQRTRSGPTVALFAADDPHQFVDRLLVLHELAAEERRVAEDLRAARTRVNSTRTALTELAARQQRQQSQLTLRKAVIEGEVTTLKQLRTLAYAGGSRYPGQGDIPVPDYVAGPAGDVVAFAFAQLGKPYIWGADGPGSYDCSGLTLAAWRTAGRSLPHNAARQYATTARLSRGDLRPGDLVFFYSPVSHVGVYIGGGRMIHAPEFGEHIRVATIDSQPIHGFGRP